METKAKVFVCPYCKEGIEVWGCEENGVINECKGCARKAGTCPKFFSLDFKSYIDNACPRCQTLLSISLRK